MKINENKIKKCALLVAILAPMIYLFGSLFAALQGAHGEQVFAEPEYTSEYVQVDSLGENGNYRFVIDQSIEPIFVAGENRGSFAFDFSFGPWNCSRAAFSTYQGTSIFYVYDGSNHDLFYYRGANDSTLVIQLPWTFQFTDSLRASAFVTFFADYGKLYKLIDVPTSTVVESATSYSDYVFKNFFVKNNFLAASGEKVIDGTPDYGFAPAADMIRYIDSNMLHLADVEWGYLVIGYVYYAFHVTIVFLMFELLMFFPHLIENIYDKFERGV